MIVKTAPPKVDRFLLIQGGTVVDEAATPSFLHFKRVNENKDFQVAVGCSDKSGKKKVLGVVANAIPKYGYSSIRISSEIDDASRLVGAALSMGELIRQRLSVYWRKGRFDNPSQLPQTVVVIGVE